MFGRIEEKRVGIMGAEGKRDAAVDMGLGRSCGRRCLAAVSWACVVLGGSVARKPRGGGGLVGSSWAQRILNQPKEERSGQPEKFTIGLW